MANSCQAVAKMAATTGLHTKKGQKAMDSAFLYGKNLGMAFQLIDDYLDFANTADQLGKPAAADLK